MSPRRSTRVLSSKSATTTGDVQTSRGSNVAASSLPKPKPRTAVKASGVSTANVGKRAATTMGVIELRQIYTRANVLARPPPSTPKRKRKHGDMESAATAPPLTPTPSAVGLMVHSYSTGDIDDVTPPPQATPQARPAQPHMTNATLQTPGGTRVIPEPHDTRLMMPGTTTDNILEKGCAHLISVDPKLKTVIEQNPCAIFSPQGLAEKIDPFRSLVSGICGQQVSGAAAKSIKNKFVGLFNEGNEGAYVWPTPQEVAKTDIPRLRQAGLSQRKAEYVQGLAEKFASGELTAKMLADASDEEILEKLIAVRGLGRWSVEMFACFALKRMDIISTGDLGVQRGMAAYLGKDVAKLKAKGGGKWKYLSEKEMLEGSEKFAPYRSLFMWYMWRIENVNVEVMENC